MSEELCVLGICWHWIDWISGLVALPSDDPVLIGGTSEFALPSLLLCLFHDGFPGELFLCSDLLESLCLEIFRLNIDPGKRTTWTKIEDSKHTLYFFSERTSKQLGRSGSDCDSGFGFNSA